MSLSPQALFKTYKPKWRRGHVYVSTGRGTYESGCGRTWPKGVLIGATCDRPLSMLRCAQCDLFEMRLGNADESYLESPEHRKRKR